MQVPAIADHDVTGLRLLVRADLNVPIQNGRVTDTTRITRFAAGMRPLLDRGARLVITTHMGRPCGLPDPALSTAILVPALSAALGAPVAHCPDIAGPAAETMARGLANGSAMLCENLRFDPREERDDPALATALARLGDAYVNDAFSCAHRAHASTHAVAELLPAFAGPLLGEELSALETALGTPKRPATAIVGGAKISSKIAVLLNLVSKVDAVIIGGGMANTFLFAQDAPMGKSLYEPDQLPMVKQVLAAAARSGCKILLPRDIVVAREFRADAPHRILPADACPDDAMILDAGPMSVARFNAELAASHTILWNGPLGAFEIPPFDKATSAVAAIAADMTRAGLAVSVAGGGDTVAALNTANAARHFTYVSTAGGAFLEWLEGKVLPGIAALERATQAA